MDPLFAKQLAALADVSPQQLIDGDPEVRERLARIFEPPAPPTYRPPEVAVESRVAVGPHGDIPVRIYRPPGGEGSGAALVWLHGGGWKFGHLDMPETDLVCREVCGRAGATVASVDYRLATDGVRFPVPLDDVVAAFRWAIAEAGSLGADPSRVSLGGASAGGNLAAGAALRLRDEGGPAPASVLLICPCVHAVLPPASPELASKLSGMPPAVTSPPELRRLLVENYLGGPLESATPYAMAALGELSGLTPTLIVTCEFDGLRASGEAYAQALAAAGVAVEAICEPGVGHGHLNMPWLDASEHSLAAMARWIGQQPHRLERAGGTAPEV
jgi:acetyl esterase